MKFDLLPLFEYVVHRCARDHGRDLRGGDPVLPSEAELGSVEELWKVFLVVTSDLTSTIKCDMEGRVPGATSLPIHVVRGSEREESTTISRARMYS